MKKEEGQGKKVAAKKVGLLRFFSSSSFFSFLLHSINQAIKRSINHFELLPLCSKGADAWEMDALPEEKPQSN